MFSIASCEVMCLGTTRLPESEDARLDPRWPPSDGAGCLASLPLARDARFAGVFAVGTVAWRLPAPDRGAAMSAVFDDDAVRTALPSAAAGRLAADFPAAPPPDLGAVALLAAFDADAGPERGPVPPLEVRAVAAGVFAAGIALRATDLPAAGRVFTDFPATGAPAAAGRAGDREGDSAVVPRTEMRFAGTALDEGGLDAGFAEAGLPAPDLVAAALPAAFVDAALPVAACPTVFFVATLLPLPLPRAVAVFPVEGLLAAGLLAPVFLLADLRGLVVAMRVSRRIVAPSSAATFDNTRGMHAR